MSEYGVDKPRGPSTAGFAASPWNPRNWGWKRWAALATGVAVLIIIIAVPVTVVQKNRYPNYSQLTYSINDTYSGDSFFDAFDYGNGTDQTNGFVNYVTQEGATFSNLTYATSSQAIIRVDDTTTTTAGRPSVKIMSKNNYTRGLFIFDVTHTPYGCGTWPAIWLSDESNWPKNGEIDIVEAVNTGTWGNQMTLHTTSGCSMKGVKRKETGKVLDTNCLNSTNGNAGCGVMGTNETYGSAFNDVGGGVYAMEWRSAGIRMWNFLRSEIPSDITSGSPDPSTWGEATADFPSTDCNINSHFSNSKIIINIEICGDWAGSSSVYTSQYGCSGTCTSFAGSNPSAFSNAFFAFKSIKVYTASGS